MRVYALNRGGLAVYGGTYDPRCDEAIVEVREDETVALIVEYPTAPTSPAKSGSGITSTTPAVVSGTNKISATLSGIQDGGYLDVSATVGGALRLVRIRGKSRTEADRYEG